MIAQPASAPRPKFMPKPSTAWSLLTLRLGLVFAMSLLTWGSLRATTGHEAFPPGAMWATLGLLPVNIVCLMLVTRRYLQLGLSLWQAMGIQRGRIAKDLGWGLIWLIVLNVPFALAVSGTVWLMYGVHAPEAFATIFTPVQETMTWSPVVLLVVAIIAVIPFILINAPVEELVFRGYSLQVLQHVLGRSGAIAATSLAFGLQHVLFAPTVPGMIVYFVAFTVWGGIAALIVTKQGRLFPVIIAHWIVNCFLSAPALVLPILMLTGVIEPS